MRRVLVVILVAVALGGCGTTVAGNQEKIDHCTNAGNYPVIDHGAVYCSRKPACVTSDIAPSDLVADRR